PAAMSRSNSLPLHDALPIWDARIPCTARPGAIGILPAAIHIVNRFYAPRVAFCPGCLTCAACTLTLAHRAMSFFPYWTLAEITRQIRSKKVSPVEIVELHLKRIETLQPKLNAFVH